MSKSKSLFILLVALLISGCSAAEEPVGQQSITLDPVPVKILISEVSTGAEENNKYDYVELYNAGSEIADLNGYSLWYQLNDDEENILLIEWDDITLIPPYGHYLLTGGGQEFDVVGDAKINQPLVPSRGGLSLRNGDNIEDKLSWGTGPAGMAESGSAAEMAPGVYLVRIPAEGETNPADSDNNQTDFSLATSPNPQNTGSPVQHDLAGDLLYTIDFPPLIKPGSEFSAELSVHNNTGIELINILVSIPLPEFITLQEGSSSGTIEGNQVEWTIPDLQSGSSFIAELPLQANFTFSDITLINSYLEVENWPLPVFNGPIYAQIGGGAIPIAVARELIGKEVVVEGISTMYVGGFFAGSGAKFYIEDETGGVQVYVSGAGATLQVPLGSTVQVRGSIEIYRDSVELIPSSEDLVVIMAGPGESVDLDPEPLSIEEFNDSGDLFNGRLLELEGRVARIEEFTYSYEIDLFDMDGNLLPLYLDKETGITLGEVEADQFYLVTGILELFDGNLRLYPRLQSDITRIYEPGLAIQVYPPITAKPGEPFEVVYTITNHAPDPDQNLLISARVDPQVEVLEVHDRGRMSNKTIVWDMDKLAGAGEQVSVSFQAQLASDTEYVVFDDYRVISSTWSESEYGIPSYTFTGETVPIWAIQGTGTRSSYNLAKLTINGVVTGVFPELEGFWIQEKESDEDPTTSPGVFVRTGPKLPDLNPGDIVTVTGRVLESFQQTELELISPANLILVGNSSLPIPVKLDPPVDDAESAAYYEALEGVLVSVPGLATVVGPTTRYGEFSGVIPYHELTRSWQNAEHGMLIHVDDGSNLTHENRDTMEYAVAVGDTIYGITGPLAFTYSNYKIEPISSYIVQASKPNLQYLDPLEEGFFSIMTWNVENLFDFVVPHPSSPPLPRVSEYKQSLSKVALTIQAAGYPTIIGIQEVENLEILEDIAAEPILVNYSYLAVLIEGTDSRGIDVGYLIREDRAIIVDQVQYPAPGNITSRPPLLVEVQLGEDSSETLYVLNNHFTSMSGGEMATEPRRNAQAAWNLEIALELLSENPQAQLAIIGDLNSYYNSLPILTIQDGGFQNVFDSLESEERYTYVYQGNSQVLDHILINESLEALLVSVNVLHSNADFPLPFSTDDSIIHKSDHDPVIAVFVLP